MSHWFDKEYLKEITTKISFTDEMIVKIFDFAEKFKPEEADEIYELLVLNKENEYDEKVKLLSENNADAGMIMLFVYLFATRHMKDVFEASNIPENIYLSTLQFFVCETNNYKRVCQRNGFYPKAWYRRQINGTIIRLGRLEFEIKKWERDDYKDLKADDYILSIHIPRGENLLHSECLESYKMAKTFFKEKFPQYNFKQIVCSSWLMGPWLKLFLSEESNIILFQNDFDLINENHDNINSWIFDEVSEKEIKDYPEDTSLQRKVKEYLLAGNKICSASKILKKEIWNNL